MPAVGDLLSLRGSLSRCTGIHTGSVAADAPDARLLLEPSAQAFCGALGYQIHEAAPLQVHQDRAVTMPFSERPIVDPDDPQSGGHGSILCGYLANVAQEGLGTDAKPQSGGNPLSGAPAYD